MYQVSTRFSESAVEQMHGGVNILSLQIKRLQVDLTRFFTLLLHQIPEQYVIPAIYSC